MYIAPPSFKYASLFINDAQRTFSLNLSVYIAPPYFFAVLPSKNEGVSVIVTSFAYTAPPLLLA